MTPSVPPDLAARAVVAHAAAAVALAREIRDAFHDAETLARDLPILRRRLRDAFKASLRIRRAA